MANPDFTQDSIKKRKAPGIPIVSKDSSSIVEPIGVHNTTPPSLADGDYAQQQMDDLGNIKTALGDPAQIADLKEVTLRDNVSGNAVTTTTDGGKIRLDVTTGLSTMPGFNIPPFDRIDATYPNTTTEVYVYSLDSSTVATITAIYTTADKDFILSTEKT